MILEEMRREARQATGRALLELQDLVVDYVTPERRVRAVDGVSLTIRAGEIVGLAGESGCGKTTTANAIMRLLRPPAEITGGRILFEGENVAALKRNELRRFRWRHISLVFILAGLDEVSNPRLRVEKTQRRAWRALLFGGRR